MAIVRHTGTAQILQRNHNTPKRNAPRFVDMVSTTLCILLIGAGVDKANVIDAAKDLLERFEGGETIPAEEVL